jgi:uncharacterized protein (DUF488 family)
MLAISTGLPKLPKPSKLTKPSTNFWYNFLRMPLYSIGHSNVEIEGFLGLLRQNHIDMLVDTRSQPFSRYSPQFNQEALRKSLALAGIAYLYMGADLGGRPQGSEFYYGEGKVDYDLLATAPFYLSAIERLIELAAARKVAFMCSEADYHHCHRYNLITRTLVRRQIPVEHILPSGGVVGSSTEDFEPEQPSLF